jgi:hypothetical protein
VGGPPPSKPAEPSASSPAQAEAEASNSTSSTAFSVDGEADASLTQRDGDDSRSAFAWYRDKGRIVAGTYDAMCDAVFTAWSKDQGRGPTSLMTAADIATVTALNQRDQACYLEAGTLPSSTWW